MAYECSPCHIKHFTEVSFCVVSVLCVFVAGSDSTRNAYKTKLMTQAVFTQYSPEHKLFLEKWNTATKTNGYHPGAPGFACPNVKTKSDSPPSSVHALRPGDIKIVAALGDSLTAANGALATNVVQVIEEYRGQAFAAGGDDNLDTTVTLPNILRTFNPSLYGYSVGIGKQEEYKVSRLNVAVPGSTAEDLPAQAQELVKRFHSDSSVDVNQDWKLVNLFIGGNDVCAYCHDKVRYGPVNYRRHIEMAIQTIYQSIPRVIVQLVGMIHVEVLRSVGKDNPTCVFMHAAECPCAAQNLTVPDSDFLEAEYGYFNATHDLMLDGKFEKDDFTVVTQPFAEHSLQGPLDASGKIDLSFFAPDCFHFHQKGHETASRYLWNSMIQPVGSKMRTANLTIHNTPLNCPEESCPFIRTTKNSVNCELFLKL